MLAMSEPPTKRRGRKRKRRGEDNDQEDELGQPEKQQQQQRVPVALVGRYLKKQFEGRSYLGKIVSYDTGLYRVEYADGDFEDLDSGVARLILTPENGGFNSKALLNKKRKLDDFIARKKAKADDKTNLSQEEEKSCSGDSDKHAVMKEQIETDIGSSGESCKSHDDSAAALLGHGEAETFFVPPLELPPSSGTIGVPEECVSHLFSVYSFLRSFSIRLFLSPFGLNEFVAALSCRVQNTLLDAIHVALLRILRRHLESQSTAGSESASKCIRCIEWDLLDSLTWPIYTVQYLIAMKYINGRDWKGFYSDVLEREYYGLSARIKLVVLQMLCDDILDSAELRAELDMREDEQGGDSEMTVIENSESVPRRVHSRFSKTSACKDEEALKSFMVIQAARVQSSVPPLNGEGAHFIANSGSIDQDSNNDDCRICGMDGTLLCCDGCPSSYHSRCIGVNKLSIPEGIWFCPECEADKIGPIVSCPTLLKSAEVFGIDSDMRVFLGACDHLLVLKAFAARDPCLRYYHKYDVIRVLQALCSSEHHITMYSGICKGISQYWKIPEDTYIIPERMEMGAVLSIQEVDISGGSLSNMVVSSSITDTASGSSSDKTTDNDSRINGMKFLVGRPFQTRLLCPGASGIFEKKSFGYTISNFQANTYTNHYCHGDFAASAAADFAFLSSEENRVLEIHASDNIKKAMSANVVLQAKAFSSAAIRFFWPNPEKKFVEVPREKCGWCLNCKAPISKKACLLNVACLSAHRGAMKFLSGLRSIKAGLSSLASIAMYMLYMEDSLSALMVGPYLNASYRQQWCKKVGQAPNCSSLKSYLLELERNIRDVALSTDWGKLVEDSSTESSSALDSSCTSTLIPKRGRRPKKPTSSAVADFEDKVDLNWWRGGKLSKLLFQKGIIPSPMVRRAARKGGSNKIAGICYATDDLGIPRKSRQLVWRAAVEMSKNTAQLALQVRSLDNNLRWSDLNRPEQGSYECKGSEKEASAFRNAIVCDKRVAGNKISYGVVFGNQKHLPLRVMKNVTDLEHGNDGRDKHWFPEARIPLYLIKEFEASRTAKLYPSAERATKTLSVLQKKQLKAARSEIFSYLVSKRDNIENCSCTACPLDGLLREATKCADCKGYCHADCTISHVIPGNGGEGSSLICEQCYFGKSTQGGISNSPTSPLLPFKVQGKGDGATKVVRGSNPGATGQQFASLVLDRTHCVVRSNASVSSALKKKKQKIASGLKWKKKKGEDNGGFVQKNLLLRGRQCFELLKPSCLLCQKPYNPDLTYIRCETCEKWYHGDAAELDETKISELMGFKCCKCRRIRSASCPYMDPDKPKPEFSGAYIMDSNIESPALESFRNIGIPFQEESSSPLCLNADDIFMDNNDPLPFSLASVEQVTEPCPDSDLGWDNLGPGPKKLPVRRQFNKEYGFDDSSGIDVNFEPVNGSIFYDTQMHENVSNDAAQDEMGFDLGNFNYEDMEFEPHTYFSMTELLEDNEETNVADSSPNNDYGTSMSDVASGTYAVKNNFDQQIYRPSGSQKIDIVKCHLCARTEPFPDLSCEICHVSVHRGCSPLVVDPSLVDGWRCVSCREWQ